MKDPEQAGGNSRIEEEKRTLAWHSPGYFRASWQDVTPLCMLKLIQAGVSVFTPYYLVYRVYQFECSFYKIIQSARST